MDALDRLVESMKRTADNARQAQIRFVECMSVDWKNKLMTAKGLSDETEYLDITLGFGYTDIKPKIGTTCLIGIIDGLEVASFLINAEEVEEVKINAGKITYNGGKNLGLVNVGQLTGQLNMIEQDLNNLKMVFKNWVTAPNDGGATLKTATADWYGEAITETDKDTIQDTNITH